MAITTHQNGLLSPPATEKASSASSPPRVVLAGKTGRILCVADIRGDYHELNRLIREHEATAVIHTGDFGFMNAESLDRMGDKILRHLLQYSPLLPPATRNQLLDIPPSAGRAKLIEALNNSSIHFPLSQFPLLISGAITFPVPVFTVWGLIEDVRVLEKFRTGEYEVHNLTVIDEASTTVVETGGVKLRLFGLGGAVAMHKIFDHGEGHATIAGGQGTMWSTALQMGELVDTAQRVFDPTETRLFITSAPIGRTGILSLLSGALQADLMISGGLHFRYPSSFNEFAIHTDFEAHKQKLKQARDSFMEVYGTVKDKVDNSMSEQQHTLLRKAIGFVMNIPEHQDSRWTEAWHWVLSDASCSHLLFSISEGRVTAETRSQGLNFSHRTSSAAAQSAVTSSSVAPSAKVAPRATTGFAQPSPSPANVPKPAAATAPVAGAGVPQRPVSQQTPAVPGNVKNILARPPPTGPSQASKPVANATATNTAPSAPSAPSNMPARPPAQTRQPRGPPAAGTPPGNSMARNKAVEAADGKTDGVVNGKASFQGNAKNGSTNAFAQKEKGRTTPIAAGKKSEQEPIEEPANRADLGPPANWADIDGTGAASAVETSTESPAAQDSKTAPAAPKAEREGKKVQDGKDDSSEAPTQPAAKKSLYIKGIPTPTTQEEIRGLFKDGLKITIVKIIIDHITKKQKDFAYVDFETEADMQEALKDHNDKIRDTAVNISVSNPPAPRFPGGGRGRGSFRGARGGPPARNGSWGRKEGGAAADKIASA